MQPYGAFTLFFRWRKKSVQKKAGGTATPEAARPASRNSQISAFRALPCPALVFAQACQSLTAFGSCAHWAHAPSRPKLRSAGAPLGLSSSSVRFAHPPGKSPLLPIFERGSSQCRAQHNWTANMNVRARSCSLFSSFKKGKAFSLRCLSPLCSPAVGVVQTYPLRVGRFVMTWIFLHRKRPAWFQIHAGLLKRAMRPIAGGLGSPTNRKSCQTGEPRGPPPSGGKTPAKQHVVQAPCAPQARSPGCRGSPPA